MHSSMQCGGRDATKLYHLRSTTVGNMEENMEGIWLITGLVYNKQERRSKWGEKKKSCSQDLMPLPNLQTVPANCDHRIQNGKKKNRSDLSKASKNMIVLHR